MKTQLQMTFIFYAAALIGISTNLTAAETYVGKAIAAYDVSRVTEHNPAKMLELANAFLDSLEPDMKLDASHPFNTPEKAVWSNLPPNPDYAGVRAGDLNEEQLTGLFDLLSASLSPEGFNKVKGILLGDDLQVRDNSPNNFRFGADNYWFFIFGEPSATEPWGWQFDGHHLAINLTVVGDKVTLSPSFIGTQPADVEWGGTVSTKPMISEVDQAFSLVNDLNEEQKQKAILGGRREDLQAGPGNDDVVPEKQGIIGSDLSDSQKSELVNLMANWINILPEANANSGLEQIKAAINETSFGWWGDTVPNSAIYYRIQGPTVLIEFANQNLGGDPQQHLHSVYRDLSNDYGKAWVSEQ